MDSMVLSKSLERKVTRTQQQIAEEILEFDEIEFHGVPDGWVGATVSGDTPVPAEVSFKYHGGTLQYQCSCEVFKRYTPQPCAHILAAVTRAEEDELIDRKGRII